MTLVTLAFVHVIYRCKPRRTTMFAAASLALIAGVGIAACGHAGKDVWAGLLAALGLLLVTQSRRTVWYALLVVLFFAFGIWRGAIFMAAKQAYEPLYGYKQTLSVVASGDGVYGLHSQISFDATTVTLASGERLRGKIQVSGFGLNAIYQGDEVVVTGKLYPSRGSYQGRVSYAQLSLVKHQDSTATMLRRRFAAGLQSALPEPSAPFAMGLLVGQRATLPDDIKQELLMVGLTHIIAVSGYNLTIMLHAAEKLFARRSKRLTTLSALVLIVVFLQLAGTSASIVRAAIVSVLTIWARYYGRAFNPTYVILLAAAITVAENPFYLWSDAGWWLSFLAFYGVLVLAPLVSARLPGFGGSIIGGVVIESLCAEVMTLPFVLHEFGQMSLIALLANVLVVSLIPLAMLLSLIAGLGGMLLPAFAGWVSWPAAKLLQYMLEVAAGLSHVPHIFIEHIGVSVRQMLLMYGCIVTAAWLVSRKTKHTKSVTITDKESMNLRGAILERT